MRLIRPSHAILAMTGHKFPFQYQPKPEYVIEAAGRTCYKSEEKITEGSARKFMMNVIARKHLTVLEHSWEVRRYHYHRHHNNLKFPLGDWNKYLFIIDRDKLNNNVYIAGNLRAMAESRKVLANFAWLKMAEEEIVNLARVRNEPKMMAATVRFICDRGVSHELVRHRPPAISQESTRYCNYTGGVQFIIPPWFNFPEGEYGFENMPFPADDPHHANFVWLLKMLLSEEGYQELSRDGQTPQQARSVLANSLKTEVVMTATLEEWQHIFIQRALSLTGKAHPQMEEVMIPVYQDFLRAEPQFFSEEVLKAKNEEARIEIPDYQG